MTRLAAVGLACFTAGALAIGQVADANPAGSSLQAIGLGNVQEPDIRRQLAKAQRQRTRYRLGYLKRGRVIRQQRRVMRRVYYGAPWGNHPDERKILCLQAYEGAWDDDHAPYWGGIQADLTFQKQYGRWAYDEYGTADRWPIAVQIAVALRAVHGDRSAGLSPRGYGPWPNTRRPCGI